MTTRLLIAVLLAPHLLLAMETSGVRAAPATCVALLPEELRSQLESVYRGWQVLESDRLDVRQRELWGSRCPGVAAGQFRAASEIAHAVVVVRQIGPKKQAKLVLAERSGSGFYIQVLRDESEVPSYPVVHHEPPGVHHEFYDRKNSIAVTNEAFVYEHLEATATLFYYEGGELRELLISD